MYYVPGVHISFTMKCANSLLMLSKTQTWTQAEPREACRNKYKHTHTCIFKVLI